MVQEARFAWEDEENGFGRPQRQDRFDAGDDRRLDPYAPDRAGKEKPANRTNKARKKSNPRTRPRRKS